MRPSFSLPCCSYQEEKKGDAATPPQPDPEPEPAARSAGRKASTRKAAASKAAAQKPTTSTAGEKRSAAAAELGEAEEQLVRRSRRKTAGSDMAGVMAWELAADSEAEAGAQPRSEAQQGMLQQLAAAAAAAEEAAAEEAAAEEVAAGEADGAAEEEEGEEGISQLAGDFQLPEHLAGARSQCLAGQTANWDKMEAGGGKHSKTFQLGQAVLFNPPKCGTAGGANIGRKTITCRVVGLPASRQYGAGSSYQLRCNSGVIQGRHAASRLKAANQALAAQLQFEGSETDGIPVITVKAAKVRELKLTVRCGCRGPCGQRCPCKVANALCGRHCKCSHGKGANCSNCVE